MEERYAILDSATHAVVNVVVFDIPEGGSLYESSGGQHWITDSEGAFHGSYMADAGQELVAVAEGIFVEAGCVRLEDGTFARPTPIAD